MAGADPVATAIRATLLYISTSPYTHNALISELRHHNLLSPSSSFSTIPYSILRTLPYFNAVIRESLRLFPPFLGITEKVVPLIGAMTPDGRFLPPGTTVGVSLTALLRDEEVFGFDAQAYRAERWIHASEGERARMERSVELVFSGGRYGCLGRDVGTMQIAKVVVELVRRFEVGVGNCMGCGRGMSEMGCVMGIWVQKGVWAVLRERGE